MREIDYKQPSFYHFSEDSIHLARISALHSTEMKQIFDLGAGSGVVGLEYLKKSSQKKTHIFFIEKQTEFLELLQFNIDHFLTSSNRADICHREFSDIDISKPSLLLSNPPFYLESEGRHPDLKTKKNCHFWKEADVQSWSHLFLKNLELGGSGFICLRQDTLNQKLIASLLPLKLLSEHGQTLFYQIS